MNDTVSPEALAGTGIAGLDDVLGGGLTRNRIYLLEGNPGTGKTTIALQFLMEGAAKGERSLLISMSEGEEELLSAAASHGWNLGGIDLVELIPSDDLLSEDKRQTLLYSSDLELAEATRKIFDKIDALAPSRVVLDSLSELQLLAQGSVRYRRQLIAMKQFFQSRRCTVLLLDDLTAEWKDRTVHSIAHGVFHLDELAPLYGAERRRMRVVKYRGKQFRGGYHDFALLTGGAEVFPRLVAAEHRRPFSAEPLRSGIPEMDQLLGGGLERGSTALILGPSGTGKSLLSLHLLKDALLRGEKVAAFIFDEEMGLLMRRAAGVGIDLEKFVAAGGLYLEQIDPAELSPGHFTHKVRRRVEQDGVGTILIDSLNGYHAAMPEEQFLVLHMHELLTFLNRQGVSTIMTVAQHGIVGEMRTQADITYLSDTLILLRYFETSGRVRRAISVVKKRTGNHEDTIRELGIDGKGMHIGPPLTQFQGVLGGVPHLVSGTSPLDQAIGNA